jgi:hypothetical protein
VVNVIRKNYKTAEIPKSDEKRDKEQFGLQQLGVNVATPVNKDNSLEEDLQENR